MYIKEQKQYLIKCIFIKFQATKSNLFFYYTGRLVICKKKKQCQHNIVLTKIL